MASYTLVFVSVETFFNCCCFELISTVHQSVMANLISPVISTVFMLIERMIQLPQENSISGIVCILLERKRLSVIIFYESN